MIFLYRRFSFDEVRVTFAHVLDISWRDVEPFGETYASGCLGCLLQQCRWLILQLQYEHWRRHVCTQREPVGHLFERRTKEVQICYDIRMFRAKLSIC